MEKLGDLCRVPVESVVAPALELNPTPNPGLSSPPPTSWLAPRALGPQHRPGPSKGILDGAAEGELQVDDQQQDRGPKQAPGDGEEIAARTLLGLRLGGAGRPGEGIGGRLLLQQLLAGLPVHNALLAGLAELAAVPPGILAAGHVDAVLAAALSVALLAQAGDEIVHEAFDVLLQHARLVQPRRAALIAQLLEDAHAHRARPLGAVQVHVEEDDQVGRLPGVPAPGTVEPAGTRRGEDRVETVETDCRKEVWGRRQSWEVEAVCLRLPEFISFPQVTAQPALLWTLLGPETPPQDALGIQQCSAISGPFSVPCRSLSALHLNAQGPCL